MDNVSNSLTSMYKITSGVPLPDTQDTAGEARTSS